MLKGLQVRDDVADLTRIEPELGHCRMAGDNSLGKRLLEVFNGIGSWKVRKGGAIFSGLSPILPIAWQREQLVLTITNLRCGG